MSLSNLPLLRPTAEPCTDPIVERNVSLLRERSTVGVQKYGTTLADNKLPLRAWLNHALEEALDQANYLQAAMAEIDSSIASQVGQNEQGLRAALQKIAGGTLDNHAEPYREIARDALQSASVQKQAQELGAVVYPPDGTVSPFTVINLGHGLVKMGDSLHDGRLPALWFGKDGLGMGATEEMNREAKEGETLAVVTFSNVEGLDVLAEVVQRIRSVAFPAAPVQPVAVPDDLDMQTIRERDYNAEMADKLAEAISKHFGIDIGEHSNMNCPWHEALEAIENTTPAMWVALNMSGKAVCANQDKSACDIERLCKKTPTTIAPLYVGASEPQ